uniref:uncharacterized protein LOC101300777 isoform X2 n=1 Tax=Fragaria vesca subsp. vesca TaxID=101020 RepID=UPI0005C800C6|nr:PREDICTED: uncharacterized protein LOC101300777 isoform X2 [Fragaria vesca subsp. vesca]
MRGNMSISDFLNKINSVVDNLALAGSPISDNDLVSIIMNNVGPLYENTVSSAQARDTPITYESLEALLLSAERRIKDQQQAALDVSSLTTAFHAAQISPRGGRGRGRGPPNYYTARNPTSNFGRGFPLNRGRGASVLGPHPSSSSLFNNQARPTCQICSKSGHTALDYYNRLNLSFQGRVPSRNLSAMAASGSTPAPPTWLLDSGANSHITSDLGNLQNPKEYQRNDRVGGIGNETPLSISHTVYMIFYIVLLHLQTYSLSIVLHQITIALC